MSPRLRIIVIGLSLSSSWGNGHATTYRALLKALAGREHDILFLEQDVPWYAANRDMTAPSFCRLRFYHDTGELASLAGEIAAADAVIVGSYVADGVRIGEWVQAIATGVTIFYDIDTPVTLAQLEIGASAYLSPDLIPDYDLYLSFTGGPTLSRIERDYGSPMARPLYCAVDEAAYQRVALPIQYDLGYLGTYSADRQPALERFLIEPARRLAHLQFVVAGPQYPTEMNWPANVRRVDHVPPHDHPAFYSACRFTLNVTRADMRRAGYSPSVRLFEAAACATPIISDAWDGIEAFFRPQKEIILAENADEIVAALTAADGTWSNKIGEAGRRRVLEQHTASHRAVELKSYIFEAQNLRATAFE